MTSAWSRDTMVTATRRQLSTILGDEVVILGLDDSVYYGLSKVGAEVWALLQTRRTIGEIADAVVASFDVTPERAEADVQALLADLHAKGLVVVAPADGA